MPVDPAVDAIAAVSDALANIGRHLAARPAQDGRGVLDAIEGLRRGFDLKLSELMNRVTELQGQIAVLRVEALPPVGVPRHFGAGARVRTDRRRAILLRMHNLPDVTPQQIVAVMNEDMAPDERPITVDALHNWRDALRLPSRRVLKHAALQQRRKELGIPDDVPLPLGMGTERRREVMARLFASGRPPTKQEAIEALNLARPPDEGVLRATGVSWLRQHWGFPPFSPLPPKLPTVTERRKTLLRELFAGEVPPTRREAVEALNAGRPADECEVTMATIDLLRFKAKIARGYRVIPAAADADNLADGVALGFGSEVSPACDAGVSAEIQPSNDISSDAVQPVAAVPALPPPPPVAAAAIHEAIAEAAAVRPPAPAPAAPASMFRRRYPARQSVLSAPPAVPTAFAEIQRWAQDHSIGFRGPDDLQRLNTARAILGKAPFAIAAEAVPA